jgi:hypothetical protein
VNAIHHLVNCGSVIRACTRDLVTYCSAGQPAASPPLECAKSRFQDFSELCQAALVKIEPVRGKDIFSLELVLFAGAVVFLLFYLW